MEDRPEIDAADLRVRWNETDESGSGLWGIGGLRNWAESILPPRERQQVIEVLAAQQMGANITVTKNRHLLRHRDDPRLREINILTPMEMGPLIGAWARTTGAGGSFAHIRPSGLYYWALARAVTPAGWPAFAAWVHGERSFPDGTLLVELAGSIFTRLDYLLRTLDEMAVVWQHEPSNSTVDRLSALMDNVLLRVWAILDNLALLIGRWFRIALLDQSAWSIASDRWRKAVREAGGGPVLHAISDVFVALKASEGLRHHAIHRELLRAMPVHGEGGPEVRVRLRNPLSQQLRSMLKSAGRRPEHWGLGDVIAPHTAHHTVNHGGGLRDRFEMEDPGGAFLDPVPFAAQLVASVADLANRVFAALDPASDPRLPEPLRDRCKQMPDDPMFTPAFGWKFAITSPLAGLVPWVEPVATV